MRFDPDFVKKRWLSTEKHCQILSNLDSTVNYGGLDRVGCGLMTINSGALDNRSGARQEFGCRGGGSRPTGNVGSGSCPVAVRFGSRSSISNQNRSTSEAGTTSLNAGKDLANLTTPIVKTSHVKE